MCVYYNNIQTDKYIVASYKRVPFNTDMRTDSLCILTVRLKCVSNKLVNICNCTNKVMSTEKDKTHFSFSPQKIK